MQGIPATAGSGIVERFAKVIAPEEPLKAAARSSLPILVVGQRICFERGGNHRIGFNRLLIEAGPLAAAFPKPVAADRGEVAGFALLLLHQPSQRLQPGVQDLATGGPMAA